MISQTELTIFPSCWLGLLHHLLSDLVNGTINHSASQVRTLGAKFDSSKQSIYSVDTSLKYISQACPFLSIFIAYLGPGHHTIYLHQWCSNRLTVLLPLLLPSFSPIFYNIGRMFILTSSREPNKGCFKNTFPLRWVLWDKANRASKKIWKQYQISYMPQT